MFVTEKFPDCHSTSESLTFRDSSSDTDGFLSPDAGEDNVFRKVRDREKNNYQGCTILKNLFNKAFYYTWYNNAWKIVLWSGTPSCPSINLIYPSINL